MEAALIGGRGALTKVTLALWMAGLLVLGAFLMAGHVVGLPLPSLANAKLQSTAMARLPGDGGKWSATHVLYEGCGCSARVLARLIQRHALPDVVETVVYVRDRAENPLPPPTTISAPLTDAGYRLETMDAVTLQKRYEIESAPVLLVGDPQGHTRYVGGYTDHSGGKNIRDLDIIAQVRRGAVAAALPVFGCAVSSRVQRAIDPLGLKYQARAP